MKRFGKSERKVTVCDLIELLRNDSEETCAVHVIPQGVSGYEGELFGRSDSSLWDNLKDLPVRRIVPSILKENNEPMLFIWLDKKEEE